MVLGMKRLPPLPTGRGQGWRGIALALLLCAVLYGFWKNAENHLDLIGRRGMVTDETGSLSRENLDNLREMAAALKDSYGVNAMILVSKGDVEWPKAGKAPLELFIAVVPGEARAVIHFSPLLRRGLDEDFCYQLQHDVLDKLVREGHVFRALSESLTRLWQRLGAIS